MANQLASLDNCCNRARGRPRIPNYLCGIVSPIKQGFWTSELARHPNQRFTALILKGLQSGFRIGFEGSLSQLKSSSQNLISAMEHPDAVIKFIEAELAECRISQVTAGELSATCGIHLSPLGAIPKKGRPNKWTETHHGPIGTSRIQCKWRIKQRQQHVSLCIRRSSRQPNLLMGKRYTHGQNGHQASIQKHTHRTGRSTLIGFPMEPNHLHWQHAPFWASLSPVYLYCYSRRVDVDNGAKRSHVDDPLHRRLPDSGETRHPRVPIEQRIDGSHVRRSRSPHWTRKIPGAMHAPRSHFWVSKLTHKPRNWDCPLKNYRP